MEISFLNDVISYEGKRHWVFMVDPDDFQDEKVKEGIEIIRENIKMDATELTFLVSQKTGIDLMELVQADEMISNPQIVKSVSKRRKVEKALSEMLQKLQKKSLTNKEVSEDMMKWSLELANERNFAFKEMSEVGENLKADCKKVWNGKNTVVLPFMKNLVEDLLGGELIILAGRPSMGKSCVMLNQAVIMAKEHTPVGYISLEMKAESLYQRIVQRHYEKSLRREKKHFTKEERIELEGFIDAYKEIPLYFSDSYSADIGSMIAAIERLVLVKKVGIVFIDYLQLIRGNQNKSKNEEVSEITRALKVLATRLQIPIVLGSQLNRMVEQREDKRPRLSDLRDSGAVEQDADIVIFCYRDGYYNYRSDEEDLDLIVKKQRDGPLGTGYMRMILKRQLVVSKENYELE